MELAGHFSVWRFGQCRGSPHYWTQSLTAASALHYWCNFGAGSKWPLPHPRLRPKPEVQILCRRFSLVPFLSRSPANTYKVYMSKGSIRMRFRTRKPAKPHRRRAASSQPQLWVYRFGELKRGRIKEGQNQKGPAPPSFPRLGARVAPQRCPILRTGKNNSNTERFGSDILSAQKDKRVCRYGKSGRYEKSTS
jgi:hypothetical protein